jgi:hypothetical protein
MLQIRNAGALAGKFKGYGIKPYEPMEGHIFARVCAGVETSPFVSPMYLKYFVERTKKPS